MCIQFDDAGLVITFMSRELGRRIAQDDIHNRKLLFYKRDHLRIVEVSLYGFNAGKFGKGIHGEMQCVACHKEITDSKANHAKAKDIKPANCVDCHQALWETARQQQGADEKNRICDGAQGQLIDTIPKFIQRRLWLAERLAMPDKPLDSPAGASLDDIAAFLRDDSMDARINETWPEYEKVLRANKAVYVAHLYANVNHGFHNDTTPRYDEAAAKLAWQRTIEFFNKYLRG